jgi:hypothetical protein
MSGSSAEPRRNSKGREQRIGPDASASSGLSLQSSVTLHATRADEASVVAADCLGQVLLLFVQHGAGRVLKLPARLARECALPSIGRHPREQGSTLKEL